MKRALIITALGGFIRSFLTNDIKILQELGYEVTCMANNNHVGSNLIYDYYKENNCCFIDAQFSSSNPFALSNLKTYLKIRKILKNNYFDLIHVHTPIAGMIVRIAARKTRKKGTKVIYTTHGFAFTDDSKSIKEKLFKIIEKICSKYCDLIITINREDYLNAMKFNSCKVKYIHGYGVDFSKFNINPKRDYVQNIVPRANMKIIVSVGELSNRKNHIAVLKALKHISDIDYCYIICGREMTNKGTKKILEKYASENKVNLLLLGQRNDLPEILNCCDLGIIPSIREGLGLSGIETLACGVPLIGNNVQGIKDYIVEDLNGYLVNINDENQLYKKILHCLTGKKWERNVISNTVRKFSKETCIKEMTAIYSDILNTFM